MNSLQLKIPYRTLVFDMDGTLLNAHNELDDSLKQLLLELKKSGYQLVVATGRTFGEVKPFMKVDEFDRYICSNGMTIHNAQFERIYHQTLPPIMLPKLVIEAAKQGIYYELRQDEGPGRVAKQHLPMLLQMLQGEQGSVSTHEWQARKSIVQELEPLEDEHFQQAVKIYFFHPQKEVIQKWRYTLQQIISDEPISIESSSEYSCEIVHFDATKGKGIERLIADGFTSNEEVICFGDSYNDLSMFQIAAYCVAMKNANDEVKQKANEVTRNTNAENGIYNWLKQQIKE